MIIQLLLRGGGQYPTFGSLLLGVGAAKRTTNSDNLPYRRSRVQVLTYKFGTLSAHKQYVLGVWDTWDGVEVRMRRSGPNPYC